MRSLKTRFLPFVLTLILLALVVVPVSAEPRMDTLGGGTDGSNPLRMDVYNDGDMGLYFWQLVSTSPDVYGYQNQYYGDTAWGTNLFLTDGEDTYGFFTPYYEYVNPTWETPDHRVAFGEGEQTADGNSVVTTWTLLDGALQFRQTITYIPGSSYVEKDFELTNLSDRTFTDIRTVHGGDTYFGGDDSATSYFNEANRMVYIRNEDMTTFGLMGYSGSPATPADHYFVGYYLDGKQYAVDGDLNDYADSAFRDAGYQLQWNLVSLAPAETFSVISYERITGANVLQILAPAEQQVDAGTTATYTFTVMNYGEEALDVVLEATSEHDWDVTFPDGDTATLPALGEAVDVTVQVAAPADAAGGTSDLLTLLATAADDPGMYASDATRTRVNAPAAAITAVTPAQTALPNGTTTLPVTIDTISLPAGTELAIRVLDADGNPLDPAVTGTANVTDDNSDGVGQALATLTLPAALPAGTYTIEVTVPETQLLHADATFTMAPAPTPTPVPPTPTPIPIPDTGESAGTGLFAGIALLTALAAIVAVRRRRGENRI